MINFLGNIIFSNENIIFPRQIINCPGKIIATKQGNKFLNNCMIYMYLYIYIYIYIYEYLYRGAADWAGRAAAAATAAAAAVCCFIIFQKKVNNIYVNKVSNRTLGPKL